MRPSWLRGAQLLALLLALVRAARMLGSVLRSRVLAAWMLRALVLAQLRQPVLRQPVLLALVLGALLLRPELLGAVVLGPLLLGAVLLRAVLLRTVLFVALLLVALLLLALVRVDVVQRALVLGAVVQRAFVQRPILRGTRVLLVVRGARQDARGAEASRSDRPRREHARSGAQMSCLTSFTGAESALPAAPRVDRDGDPRRILIFERALGAATCQMIASYAAAHAAEAVPARVAGNAGQSGRIDTAVRSTSVVPTRALGGRLNGIVGALLAAYVEPFFGGQVEWWERPRLLRYVPGDRYGLHADADRRVDLGERGTIWRRHLDRDVSFILYVNDAFTGGKLHFPAQNLKIEPKKGLLVAFPSSAAYLHEAEPTESGVRFALVSWAALVGHPRVNPRPADVVFRRSNVDVGG
jgi:predicted 2-oxoglutarate/Fe(II)-dependent dioxygenase YbiX